MSSYQPSSKLKQSLCGHQQQKTNKCLQQNNTVLLYPTMHGGSETPFARAPDAGCPPPPRTPPPRRILVPSRQLISPPVPHRVTVQRRHHTTAPGFERIGNPSLQMFRLKLPRALVGRLDGILAHAERYAQTLPDGWRTDLYSLTKQDLALREIPGMHHRIQPIVDYMHYAIQRLYGCRKVICDKNQPHILKYSVQSGHTGGKNSNWCASDCISLVDHWV
jgi:hypothetical protein